MQRDIVSESRKSQLLKSCLGAIGLVAAMGCVNVAVAHDSSPNPGTQNATLLQHMGISDTSYTSMESHGGDHGVVFRPRHAS